MTKPTLYLVHGWGMNQAVWNQVIEQLSPTVNCIPLDLAGFGEQSSQSLQPYNLQTLTDELATRITVPGFILGWSLGGLVAQDLAIRYATQVSGVITVASTPFFAEQINDHNRWPGIKKTVLHAFQAQLAQDYHKTLERFLAIQAMGSPTAKQDIKRLKSQLLAYPTPHLSALKGGLEILEQADVRSDIIHISQPTLRLYGRLDSLVPQKVIPLIEALQPNSVNYLFEHASHAPFISHIDEFVLVLKQFLAEHAT